MNVHLTPSLRGALAPKQSSRFFSCFLALFFILTTTTYAARTTVAPLQSTEAFALSVNFTQPNEITASWQIAPDYYLYTEKLHIDFAPPVKAQIQMPTGATQQHEVLGRFQAYTGDIKAVIHLPEDMQQSIMTISYQGCSGSGFCYPPMQQRYEVNAAAQTLIPLANLKERFTVLHFFKSLLTDQEGVRTLLSQQQPFSLLLIFFGLGLLLAFTPCVLPMVPILTSIIVGQKHRFGTRKAFIFSFTYVLGMALTYALAGMVAASLGNSLQVWLQQPIIISIVSGVFILLALSLFGLYELRFSRRWHTKIATWSDRHEGGTFFGVFCMGILSTLVVSPCITAPLAGVLIYIGQTGNLIFGASALFAMGMGMGVPLLLIGMSAGKWLPKSGAWMNVVKEFFGIFMVAMAIWLFSRIVSPTTTRILFGLLFLGTAFYIGLYLPRLIRYRKTNHVFGVLVGAIGILIMANALMSRGVLTQGVARPFIIVQNIEELSQQLEKAKTAHQLVLVDFYADWCETCVAMDKQVFDRMQVQQALQKFVLLRVDLSTNSAAYRAILKRYNVVAPPTVLLFGPKGTEFDSHRIIGDIDADDFLSRLQSFRTASCDNKEPNQC